MNNHSPAAIATFEEARIPAARSGPEVHVQGVAAGAGVEEGDGTSAGDVAEMEDTAVESDWEVVSMAASSADERDWIDIVAGEGVG